MLKTAILRNWLLALAIGAIVAASARAERLEDIPNPKARDNTWVTELAGKLRLQTISEVNEIINNLEKQTSAEMVLVVIRTLDGAPERQFATDLLRRWGVGKRDANNGLLFLWAVDDRRVAVEVGYGLEPILPDGKVGSILDRYTISHFKAGEFDQGVLEGIKAFAAVIRSEPVDAPPVTVQSYKKGASDEGASPFLWLFAMAAAMSGSFVGYRFWRRYRGRKCAQCQSAMARVKEEEDDEFLGKAEIMEEKLGSVDYDVWKCARCSHQMTLRYPKWFSGYHKCPQCNHHTCWSNETTIRAATTISEGEAKVTEKCEYCKYHQSYNKKIPRLPANTTSSGSSWTGSSGGYSSGSSSGGGFSGSSGGGSFGGGSSGGGGASRGY